MARGTGTGRALSEANISELIRGNPAALAAQAAKGGNTKPTPAPAATPTPGAKQPTPTANAPTPATAPANQPPAATPEEEKGEEKKVVTKGLSISGYSNPFMGSQGYNVEGSDAGVVAEQKEEELKRKLKKITSKPGAGQVTPPAGSPPTK